MGRELAAGVMEKGSQSEGRSCLETWRGEQSSNNGAPEFPNGRRFRASFAEQTSGFYLDCMFICSALGVSYIIGLAAITETQNKSGFHNTEIRFSLL